MTELSRRSMLAGAAAVPAVVAVPALAEQGCSFPELAAEFDEVYRRWLDRSTRDQEWSRKYDAALEAKTGMPRSEQNKGWRYDMPENEREARHALLNSIDVHQDDPIDENGASIEWSEISEDVISIAEEIMAQPAKTMGDMGLQLRAFAFVESDLWMKGEDLDEFVAQPRAIVDLAARFVGVDLFPGADHLIGVLA